MAYRCSGCGCRYVERNFEFGDRGPYRRRSELREDAIEAGGWGRFDQDDSQVHQILSLKWGWFLGTKAYDITLASSSMNMDDPAFKTSYPPPPPSLPEATTADFYDARNLSGRWKYLGWELRPRDLKGAVSMIRKAGLRIPQEVLEREMRFGDYRFLEKKPAKVNALVVNSFVDISFEEGRGYGEGSGQRNC